LKRTIFTRFIFLEGLVYCEFLFVCSVLVVDDVGCFIWFSIMAKLYLTDKRT